MHRRGPASAQPHGMLYIKSPCISNWGKPTNFIEMSSMYRAIRLVLREQSYEPHAMSCPPTLLFLCHIASLAPPPISSTPQRRLHCMAAGQAAAPVKLLYWTDNSYFVDPTYMSELHTQLASF